MIDVTCAVIRDEEERVLVVQHGGESDHPWQWEFPGGKLKRGEDPEECIIREIEEELSISVVICRALTAVVHDYGFRKIRLIPFVCDTIDNGITLSEHAAYNWTEALNLLNYSLTEADIPVAREYISLFADGNEGTDREEDASPGTQPDLIMGPVQDREQEGGRVVPDKEVKVPGIDTGKAGDKNHYPGAAVESSEAGDKNHFPGAAVESSESGDKNHFPGAAVESSESGADMEGLKEILSGSISVDACRMLADAALTDTLLLMQLFRISVTEAHPVSFRASWSLTMVDEQDSNRLKPLLKDMALELAGLTSESVIRSFLKIMGRADINLLEEKEHGIVATCCFNWLSSPSTAVALKVYSMELLYKLTLIYPAMSGELYSSLLREAENGSAGIRARAGFVMERLKKQGALRPGP